MVIMNKKKQLYETIMSSVAIQVKKALNEYNTTQQNDALSDYIYNADLSHCPKTDILYDSWIEEEYAEAKGIETCDVEYNEEFFTYCKDRLIDELYEGIDSFKMDENDMIYCERMLYIKDPDIQKILNNPLGIYWSWKSGNSKAINSQIHGNVVIYARISAEDVNWAQTIISNLIDPDETELTIKSGAEIIVNKITINNQDVFEKNAKCIA